MILVDYTISFLLTYFKGVLDTKVPATTLVRLEYILLICQYICQHSETFCITLGETGFAQCLDGMVHALSVHELYADLPQVHYCIVHILVIIKTIYFLLIEFAYCECCQISYI